MGDWRRISLVDLAEGWERMDLTLNGRFLGRPVTGVERVAIELTRAMRDLLRSRGDTDIEVAVPPGVAVGDALGAAPVVRTVGSRSGHGWEQFDLPRISATEWLLSLCNTGPAFRRRHAVVIHDALFIDHPESFSWAFRCWYRALLTIIARRAAVVLTVSDYSRRVLERHRIVAPGKTHVLRLGVEHVHAVTADDTILGRIDVRPGGYLLTIGSRAPHKNLEMLARAFQDAAVEGVTLVFAGGGNARVFQDAGLPEGPTIRYTGRISDEELRALYDNAMAFACPSLSEGFGLPPLEAMARGCPVLATTGGSVPEILGDAPIYIDPHDPAAWRDEIRRLCGDAALRGRLRAAGRERAAAFTWHGAAEALLAVMSSADDAVNKAVAR